MKGKGDIVAKSSLAGAAQLDITPEKRSFLHGYPHVERYHTGVHDRLFTSALWLDDGQHPVVFIGNDILYLPNDLCRRARQKIASQLGISTSQVMLTASHTHSAPVACEILCTSHDTAVPRPDPEYLQKLEEAIIRVAGLAKQNAKPATLVTAIADSTGLGTNRHDPAGPRIREIPVLAAYEAGTTRPIAIMAVCSMHPTVLHEDSTLISGDFPGLARTHLQQTLLAPDLPFVYHMGASGNQSPRHVVSQNTFEQADRLGGLLASSITKALATAKPVNSWQLQARTTEIDLPVRSFPSIAEAEKQETAARNRLDQLRRDHAPRTTIRTAEVDWFGAEETVTLSRAAATDQLARTVKSILPVVIQVIRVGDLQFVGWPGEVFVEFAIELRQKFPNAHIVTVANGHLDGYLVTQQAVDQKAYESGIALFASPQSGELLVATSEKLLTAIAEK